MVMAAAVVVLLLMMVPLLNAMVVPTVRFLHLLLLLLLLLLLVMMVLMMMMMVRRHLVSAADGRRIGHHVVTGVLLNGGCGCGGGSGRGGRSHARPGLFGTPVLSAATRCPATPVMLSRGFESGRLPLLFFRSDYSHPRRLPGHLSPRRPTVSPLSARPWLRALAAAATAAAAAVLGRFVVLVL